MATIYVRCSETKRTHVSPWCDKNGGPYHEHRSVALVSVGVESLASLGEETTLNIHDESLFSDFEPGKIYEIEIRPSSLSEADLPGGSLQITGWTARTHPESATVAESPLESETTFDSESAP